MRYFKTEFGYFASPREIPGAEEITKDAYGAFLAALSRKPEVPEGYACRLTQALEWETYALPESGVPDPDLSDSEIMEIILGGAV